jgi:hypothetical protein
MLSLPYMIDFFGSSKSTYKTGNLGLNINFKQIFFSLLRFEAVFNLEIKQRYFKHIFPWFKAHCLQHLRVRPELLHLIVVRDFQYINLKHHDIKNRGYGKI